VCHPRLFNLPPPYGGLESELSGINTMLGKQVQQPLTGGIVTSRTPSVGAGEAARREAITSAGDVIGRGPKATQREAMLQRLAAGNKAAMDLRGKNRFLDYTAGAGGIGAFANIGRTAANMRRQDAALKDAELRRELGLEEVNIKGDVDIAGKQVTAGEYAAKAALEKLGREALIKFKKAATVSKSRSEAIKNRTAITKAIANIRQKNLEAVGEVLASRVDLIQLKREAADGDKEAIAKLDAIYKKAEEKATIRTRQVLIELQALRVKADNEVAGFGDAKRKKTP